MQGASEGRGTRGHPPTVRHLGTVPRGSTHAGGTRVWQGGTFQVTDVRSISLPSLGTCHVGTLTPECSLAGPAFWGSGTTVRLCSRADPHSSLVQCLEQGGVAAINQLSTQETERALCAEGLGGLLAVRVSGPTTCSHAPGFP